MKRDRNEGFYSERCQLEASISLCFEWAGYLVPRDAVPPFHNIVARTELCAQRTLLFRLYFFRTQLLVGQGGGGAYRLFQGQAMGSQTCTWRCGWQYSLHNQAGQGSMKSLKLQGGGSIDRDHYIHWRLKEIFPAGRLCLLGGALSAVRAQCNYLGVWPYLRPIGGTLVRRSRAGHLL